MEPQYVYVREGTVVTRLSEKVIPRIYFEYGFQEATENDYNAWLLAREQRRAYEREHPQPENKSHSVHYDEYSGVTQFDQSDPFGKW